jgi:predicted nuclease of predicted toxin-antitoxin system
VKILLDECVDQRFRRDLIGHEVITVREAGWAGKKNGELLALAATTYLVFITVDRNLYFQQNFSNFNIAVLILEARSNRLADLRPLAKDVFIGAVSVKAGTGFNHPQKIELNRYFLLALAIASSADSSTFSALSRARHSGVNSKLTPC